MDKPNCKYIVYSRDLTNFSSRQTFDAIKT